MDLTSAAWRKSSYSSNGGETCVEVAAHQGSPVVAVRDSTDRGGPRLWFGPAEWRRFAARVKQAAGPGA